MGHHAAATHGTLRIPAGRRAECVAWPRAQRCSHRREDASSVGTRLRRHHRLSWRLGRLELYPECVEQRATRRTRGAGLWRCLEAAAFDMLG